MYYLLVTFQFACELVPMQEDPPSQGVGVYERTHVYIIVFFVCTITRHWTICSAPGRGWILCHTLGCKPFPFWIRLAFLTLKFISQFRNIVANE